MQMILMGWFAIKPELIKPSVPQKEHLANSVDPDQMPLNVASDQGLHCVYEMQEFLWNMVTIKINQTHPVLEMDWSKDWRWKSPLGINGLKWTC